MLCLYRHAQPYTVPAYGDDLTIKSSKSVALSIGESGDNTRRTVCSVVIEWPVGSMWAGRMYLDVPTDYSLLSRWITTEWKCLTYGALGIGSHN